MSAVAYVIQSVLELDKSNFSKGLKDSQSDAMSFGKKFEGMCKQAKTVFTAIAGAAAVKSIVSGIKSLVQETSDYGDHIDKMAQKLGLSNQRYQEWAYVLDANGASIDSLGKMMQNVNNAAAGFQDASADVRKNYRELGISLHDLNGMSVDKRLETVVKAFQKMPDGVHKSNLALKIFGGQAAELMPLLNGSAEDLDALIKEFHESGGMMSDEDIANAAAYGDALSRFQKTVAGIKRTIGAKFLPTFTDWLNKGAEGLGRLSTAYQKGGIKALLSEAHSMIVNIKLPTWGEIKETISEGWNAILPELSKIISAVVGIEPDTVQNALKNVTGFASDFVEAATDLFGVAISIIGGDLPTAAIKAKKFFRDVLNLAAGVGHFIFGILGVKEGDIEKAKNTAKKWIEEVEKEINHIVVVLDVKEDDPPEIVIAKAEKWLFDKVQSKLKAVRTKMDINDDDNGFVALGKAEAWFIQKIQNKLHAVTVEMDVNDSDDAGNIILKASKWFTDKVTKGVAPVLAKLGIDIMGTSTTDVIDAANGFFDGIKGSIHAVKAMLGIDDSAEAMIVVKGKVMAFFRTVSEGFSKILEIVFGIKMPDVSKTTKDFTTFKNSLLENIGNLLGFEITMQLPDLSTMIKNVGKLMSDLWNSVKDALTLPINLVPQVVQNGVNAASEFANNIASMFGLGTPHESGLVRVPYSGYQATLHKDEAVLTRVQAQEWRSGMSGGMRGESIDYDRMALAVAGAMSNVRFDLDGETITRRVNKGQALEARQRRYK